MIKNKSSISKAQDYQEIGDFWDVQNLADYWDETIPADFEVDIQSKRSLLLPNQGMGYDF